MALPWEPLFTVERSGTPEVTVSGIISIRDGNKSILSVGDEQALLWSRSLLKPWQLLPQIPLLRQSYPVHSQHFAMMLASHNGESWHLEYLKELLMLGGLDEIHLQCPACYPMSAETRFQLKSQGMRPKAIYNPCSGKHIAYLLSLAAQGKPVDRYLEKDGEHFAELKRLLKWLLETQEEGEAGRKPALPEEIPETIDGCRLPNYGFSAAQMGGMYRDLATDLSKERLDAAPQDLQTILAEWHYLRHLMQNHPTLVGGTERLDSRLMSGEFTSSEIALVAKEGAEGLLGLGIAPCDAYPRGLGILVKLASGYDLRYLEMVITNILQQLGLSKPQEKQKDAHVQTIFHYRVPQHQKA
jgi:L-asparaginase II